jgi:hypothetical protein
MIANLCRDCPRFERADAGVLPPLREPITVHCPTDGVDCLAAHDPHGTTIAYELYGLNLGGFDEAMVRWHQGWSSGPRARTN